MAIVVAVHISELYVVKKAFLLHSERSLQPDTCAFAFAFGALSDHATECTSLPPRVGRSLLPLHLSTNEPYDTLSLESGSTVPVIVMEKRLGGMNISPLLA